MDKQPELSTKLEIAGFIVETAAGAIPFAGGAITAAVLPAMKRRHERRMKIWLDNLAEAVERLGLDLDALATDDVFIDTLIAATNAATNTAHEEKMHALRNAVLSSAQIESRPEEEMSVRFIRLVDEMSLSHLRLMAYFEDPRKWFEDAGNRSLPDISTHLELASIAMGWEGSGSSRLDWLIEDLSSWRILGVLNSSNGTTSGLLNSRNLTSLGLAFMTYIREPDVPVDYSEQL